jgi:hypothetical protein
MAEHDMDSHELHMAAWEALAAHGQQLARRGSHEHVDVDTINAEVRVCCEAQAATLLAEHCTWTPDPWVPNVWGAFNGDTCVAIYWRCEADVELGEGFDVLLARAAKRAERRRADRHDNGCNETRFVQ